MLKVFKHEGTKKENIEMKMEVLVMQKKTATQEQIDLL